MNAFFDKTIRANPGVKFSKRETLQSPTFRVCRPQLRSKQFTMHRLRGLFACATRTAQITTGFMVVLNTAECSEKQPKLSSWFKKSAESKWDFPEIPPFHPQAVSKPTEKKGPGRPRKVPVVTAPLQVRPYSPSRRDPLQLLDLSLPNLWFPMIQAAVLKIKMLPSQYQCMRFL